MSATISYSAQGTVLNVLMGSPAVLTPILQSKGYTGPSINWTIEDITNLSSPGGFKEKKPVAKDPGPCSFDLIYNPADPAHEYLRASNAAAVSVLEHFTLVMSSVTPKTVTFDGYVTKFEFDNQAIKVGTVKVEITNSGPIT